MASLRCSIVAVLATAALIGSPAPSTAAPRPLDQGGPLCVNVGHCPAPRSSTASATRAKSTRSPAIAAGLTQCDDDTGAYCGSVTVPVDYRIPRGRKLAIAFRLIPHTTDSAAIGTLNYIAGSGESAIQVGDQVGYILGDAQAAYDVLLIDGRGRGASGAVDCPLLQHGDPDLHAAFAECVSILGPDVDAYTSTNDARDRDAVRAKLRIPKLDIVAKSYGGLEALAYAARFGSHLHSLVLADAVTPATNDFVQRNVDLTSTSARTQAVQCAGSTRCRKELGDPIPGLAKAAKTLHAHPLVGDTYDLYGARQHVTVDELTLYYAASMDTSAPASAWLAGAIDSWRHGDDAPLLRVGGALSGSPYGDAGPADGANGVGELQASDCADNTTKPWRNGLSESQRVASAQAAIRRADPRRFFPFSGADLNEVPFFAPEDAMLCTAWPDTPGAEAVVPKGTKLPDIPVLGMVGAFDRAVPADETTAWVERFPKGKVTVMPQGSHPLALFVCGDVLDAFLRTGAAPKTCGEDWHWWPQASNPRTVAAVSAAAVRRATGDASTAPDRRVADAAWRTFLDGYNTTNRPGFAPSKGLRGGGLTDSYDDATSEYFIDFDHYRFVDDLAITGRMTAPATDDPASGTYRIDGPNGITGSLTIAAQIGPFRDGVVSIIGTIGGRTIRLTTTSI